MNTWERENSKVACATLSIPDDSTLLMQGNQYPTSNLVMPQLYRMIAKLEMPSVKYIHTAQKETIPVHAALEKAFRPEMMKNSFKNYNMWSTRKYVQNTQLCTEYIVLQDFMTATLTCCLVCSQKYNLAWGLQQLREV